MKNLYLLAGMFLLALLTSCGDCGSDAAAPPTAPPVVTPPPAPRVARLEFASPDLSASTKAVRARMVTRDVPADFELGDLESTATFLFILKNTGTADLQNVQITCTDPSVVCTPAQIGILRPEGAGGLTPVIQVKVVHGASASGLVDAPLLAAGRWTSLLKAQGTSVGSPDVISAAASLGCNVQVAAFEVREGTQSLDLASGGWINGIAQGSQPWYSYGPLGNISMPTWDTDKWTAVPLLQGDITLVNTGNAPLVVQRFQEDTVVSGNPHLFRNAETVTVQPGETLAPAPSGLVHTSYPGYWFDSQGTFLGTSPTGQTSNWVMLRVSSPAQMTRQYFKVAPGVWQGAVRHNGPDAPTGSG